MKKYMTMPDVKVVRFDNKDVIVTSVRTNDEVGNKMIMTQERRSIWDAE